MGAPPGRHRPAVKRGARTRGPLADGQHKRTRPRSSGSGKKMTFCGPVLVLAVAGLVDRVRQSYEIGRAHV